MIIIAPFQKNVDKWHELMQPKLHEAEKRSTFCIRDYASRIIETLKTSGQRKINFDTVIQTERACEVARYFLASLDLVGYDFFFFFYYDATRFLTEICLSAGLETKCGYKHGHGSRAQYRNSST